jgi:hypothetical protein
VLDFTSPWVTVGLALASVLIAWITYRSQRSKTRLEYAIVASVKLLPVGVPKDLKVSLGERQISDPHVLAVRIVNTGDKSIRAASFDTDLSISLTDVREVVEVSATSSRPLDLGAEIVADGVDVKISPLLWNPGDMIQIQILSDGSPSGVAVLGRVEDLPKVSRRSLPYPPGTGAEGEMIGFDKFIWFFLDPICDVGLVALIAFGPLLGGRTYTSLQFVNAAILIALGLALYVIIARKLVLRRRMWKA